MKAKLAYGRTQLEVTLPDDRVAKCLEFQSLPPIDLPTAVLNGALHVPINSAPLHELAVGKKSACVVISDITRPVPNQVILPPILQTLEEGWHASRKRADPCRNRFASVKYARGTRRNVRRGNRRKISH